MCYLLTLTDKRYIIKLGKLNQSTVADAIIVCLCCLDCKYKCCRTSRIIDE